MGAGHRAELQAEGPGLLCSRSRSAAALICTLAVQTGLLRCGACHRARIRATRWWPPPAITAKPLRGDEVQLVETRQPHAEERATRASRSMGRSDSPISHSRY